MGGGALVTEASHRIDEIIESTLPSAERQRYKAVFELARALKAEPTFADADPRDLEPIVRRWHQRALPVIGTVAERGKGNGDRRRSTARRKLGVLLGAKWLARVD